MTTKTINVTATIYSEARHETEVIVRVDGVEHDAILLFHRNDLALAHRRHSDRADAYCRAVSGERTLAAQIIAFADAEVSNAPRTRMSIQFLASVAEAAMFNTEAK